MPEDRKHIMGRGGFCVCPKCDNRASHSRNKPCQQERCPKCGAKLLREGSPHHDLFLKKQRESRNS